jgi:thiaminase/transcriptional activator TenA
LGNLDENYNTISPACLFYGNFLLRTSVLESFEVSISAILPCFLVYQKVGQYASKYAKPSNLFSQWISTYACEEFTREVYSITAIFNEVAENSSINTQEKMGEAFYKSSVLQYCFWGDAYKLRAYDMLI